MNLSLIDGFLPRINLSRNVINNYTLTDYQNININTSHELRHVDIKMVSINVQGCSRRDSISKLETWVRLFDYDVVVIQETSFKDGIGMKYGINGYYLAAVNNKPGSGKNGGVAILIKNKYKPHVKILPLPHTFKKVQLCGVVFDKINIIGVYRSPAQSAKEAVEFADFLVDKIPKQSLIMMGDFNCGQWNCVDRLPKDRRQRIVVKALNRLNLIQHVDTPTRKENILDLCLTYNNDKIKEVYVEHGWNKVENDELKCVYDHKPVVCVFSSRPNYEAYYEVKDYNKVDIRKLERYIKDKKLAHFEHSISHFLVVKDGILRQCVCGKEVCTKLGLCDCGEAHDPFVEIEERHRRLADAIREGFEHASPMKKVYYYTESMNRHGQQTMTQMKKIKNMKTHNYPRERILDEEFRLQELINQDKKKEAQDMMCFWDQDRNNVYRTIDRLKKNKPKADGVYRDVDNNDYTLVFSETERAHILKEHSKKVLQDTNAYDVTWDDFVMEMDEAPFPGRLREPEIDETIVHYYIMDRCKKKKSIASCNLSMYMLKTALEFVIKPLTRLYRMAYSYNYTPNPWNTSKIVFIPKRAEDLADPNNLRGLNVVSPVHLGFEFILCESQYEQIEHMVIFSDCQWGMRNKRSCETQLIHFTDFVTKTEQGSNGTITLWTDYSKAFDVCCHSTIMQRMKDHRFSPGVGKVFQHWLGNSKQFVQVGNTRSEEIPVKSSIKQGSVFAGKLAFNLMINTMFEKVYAKARELGIEEQIQIASYCDDTKIYMFFKHGQSKIVQLKKFQQIVDVFIEWSNEAKLKLNPKKCVAMVKMIPEQILKEAMMMFGDSPMIFVEEEVDLGCTITKTKGVSAHVKKKTNTALAVIQSIKHIVPRLTFDIQLQLWNTLIRATCLYASFVMFPMKKADKKLYQKVFKTYWRLSRGSYTRNDKKPITILQMMTIRELIWHRDAMFQPYPLALKPEPREVHYSEIDLRLSQRLITLEKRTFPAAGSLALTRSINKLKKSRKESFRYRNIELFRQIPINVLLMYNGYEFKKYLKEKFITSYDQTETKLVDDAFDGELREKYLRHIERKIDFAKTTEECETYESDTEDEYDGVDEDDQLSDDD